jgi:hypothetical protein
VVEYIFDHSPQTGNEASLSSVLLCVVLNLAIGLIIVGSIHVE